MNLRWVLPVGRASLAAMALLLAPAVQAADAAAGKSAYTVCSTCHGANGEGNPALHAPRIAGQEAWYLTRQIELFRSGGRGRAPGDTTGMQMQPMAMTLQPPQVADVVAYIGTLNAPPNAPTVKGDVARGKTLYAVCAACHGQQGEGQETLGGPRLAGQDDWYLVAQLGKYRSGQRGADPKDVHGAQMRPMAMTLADDAAVADVVAYIRSLP